MVWLTCLHWGVLGVQLVFSIISGGSDALKDGLAVTPPMGYSPWNAFRGTDFTGAFSSGVSGCVKR